jgi:hypothetical protein
MPQLRTRCDAHHKKALCVGQERRVVRSAPRRTRVGQRTAFQTGHKSTPNRKSLPNSIAFC